MATKKNEQATSQTTATGGNKILDAVKKRHEAQAIRNKDFAFKNLFELNPKCRPYQQEDGTALLTITEMSCKFVPKYKDDAKGQAGYHTTLVLSDGKITGSFSSALLGFFDFMSSLAGIVEHDNFRSINLRGETIVVKVSKIELDGGRGTYNFEIVGGTIGEKITMIGGGGASVLQLAGDTED